MSKKLDRLLEMQTQLSERIAKTKSKEKEDSRKAENQKHIILGSTFQTVMKSNAMHSRQAFHLCLASMDERNRNIFTNKTKVDNTDKKVRLLNEKIIQLKNQVTQLQKKNKVDVRKNETRKKLLLGIALKTIKRTTSDQNVIDAYHLCLKQMNEKDRSIFRK